MRNRYYYRWGRTGGGGDSGGGTSPSTPPDYNPCPPAPGPVASSLNGTKRINLVQGCPVNNPSDPPNGKPPTTSPFVIKLDSLSKYFPCASKLIIKELASVPGFSSFIAPFSGTLKPDLEWETGNLSWNSPTPGSTSTIYQLGSTSYIGRSAKVTLNSNMLTNNSQLLIASTAIHETLHAFVNYNIETVIGGYPLPAGYDPNATWLSSINTWAIINGLPSNYRDHYEMLDEYFDKAVDILSIWDKNNGQKFTLKEYRMAMLYGLDNPDSASPSQKTLLLNEYTAIMTRYGITTSDLSTFYQSNLNSSVHKLPTTGCN